MNSVGRSKASHFHLLSFSQVNNVALAASVAVLHDHMLVTKAAR